MDLGIARFVFQRGFVQADRARKVARGRFALCIFELLRVPRRNHSITAGTKQRGHEGQKDETHRASDNHRLWRTATRKDAMATDPAAVPSSAVCERMNI